MSLILQPESLENKKKYFDAGRPFVQERNAIEAASVRHGNVEGAQQRFQGIKILSLNLFRIQNGSFRQSERYCTLFFPSSYLAFIALKYFP